jgi:crossover junction endodeoxyribonuclease RuvC
MIDRRSINDPPAPVADDVAPHVAVGFDPGAAHVGWAVLASRPAGVTLVASGVLEVEPSDQGLAALRLAAGGLFDTHRPAIVALERERAVYVRGRFGSSMASGLVGAAWSGGELAGLAAARGLEVHTLTHTETKIAIGAPAGDGRAVTAALRARVAGWRRVSEHERDAAAVALAVLCERGRDG